MTAVPFSSAIPTFLDAFSYSLSPSLQAQSLETRQGIGMRLDLMELSPHTPAGASPPECSCCLQEGGGHLLTHLGLLFSHPERDKHGTGGLPSSLLPPIRAHQPLVPACSSMLRCGPWHWYPFPHFQLPPSCLLRLGYERYPHCLQNTELQRDEDFCSILISVFHWCMARWAGKIFLNPSFIPIIQTSPLPTGWWIQMRATV